MPFKDYFSGHAGDYAAFRPHYPPDLFAWLAEQTPGHALAWDCGCGNGQAAVLLADYFTSVFATDPSAEQIAHAQLHPRVTYRVEAAEKSSLANASVDLITVAQAMHWFDMPAFFREVQRVLRPGAVLAVWAYGVHHLEPELDRIVDHYYRDIVGPYWPPERNHIDQEYRTIPFPYPERPTPSFVMTHDWTLAQLLGYIRSWSATKQYEKRVGGNPLEQILPDLERAWGDPQMPRRITWPVYLKVGRKD
jgi:SAM-dependent methyltransferase